MRGAGGYETVAIEAHGNARVSERAAAEIVATLPLLPASVRSLAITCSRGIKATHKAQIAEAAKQLRLDELAC